MTGRILPNGKFLVAVGARNMIHYRQKRDIMVEAQKVAKIGEMVKKVRKEQKVTQVQLAQLSNVGYRFVLDLEAGKETIQLGKVLAVMETLGMRVNLDLPPGSEVENG